MSEDKKEHIIGKGTTTPLMQQYFAIKNKYQEELIFFQVGDFYELFFQDAQIAAKILTITLTKRGQHDGKDIPLCGIPVHMIEQYYPKLIRRGYTVVICGQTESAQVGKLVNRAVIDIITPSTLSTAEVAESSFSLYVYHSETVVYTFWFEFLEQKISYGSYHQNEAGIVLLKSALKKYNPKEIIVHHYQLEFFWHFFNKEYKIKSFDSAKGTASSVGQYLAAQRLPAEFEPLVLLFLSYMSFYFQTILEKKNIFFEEEKMQQFLFLDESTTTYLELTENLTYKEKEHTLFGFLDQTASNMGSRLLKKWINYPLKGKTEIECRQQVIAFFLENREIGERLSLFLASFGDLERLFQRTRLKKITNKEYKKFIQFQETYKEFSVFLEAIRERIPLSVELISESFLKTISDYINVDQSCLVNNEVVIISPTVSESLSYYYKIIHDQQKIIIDFLEKEKEKTTIDELVIKSTPLYGYTFELSKIKEKRYVIPDYFLRVQTLTNKERYTSPELQKLSFDLTHAFEKYSEEEKKAKEAFLEICINEQNKLLSFARDLALIDVYISLATVAADCDWEKPLIKEKNTELMIKNGKHPLFSQKSNFFVSNSLNLEAKRTVLLTGPNMGGKSTYMRQNALIVILAHIGSFVPAEHAEIPLMESIFTRIGASDSLEAGKSTFFVELEQINTILHFATSSSFIIIDEIGRGTSTYDGIALAASVLEFLCTQVNPYMICSTHYHELVHLIDNSFVEWCYMGYHIKKDTIHFLYTLLSGVSNNSMGIALAEKIGLPKEITKRARGYFQKLENQSALLEKKEKIVPAEAVKKDEIESLKCSAQIKSLLREIDILELTPRKAFELIEKLKNLLD